MSSEGDNAAPVYLMPIAAVTGMYALGALLLVVAKAFSYVSRSFTKQKSNALSSHRQAHTRDPIIFSSLWFQLVSGIIASICYAYVVARVNDGMGATVFDPFEILGVEMAANATIVKKAYRSLSLLHHPDKGGDPATFNMIALAYKALNDEVSRENWEKFGHPDGPQSQTLSFALPDWLLKPTGSTAAVLVLLYFGIFVALIAYVVRFVTNSGKSNDTSAMSLDVSAEDMQYLNNNLKPSSNHIDILCHIATTPSSISISNQQLKKYEQLLSEKKKSLATESTRRKNAAESANALLDDSGWADDDEEEESDTKKHEKELRQRQALQKEASGNDPSKENVFEGFDKGAIGWKWVENVLEQEKVWPPRYDFLRGSQSKSLDNPALRRNMALLTGRINSQILNNHPDLVKAASERLLDTRYFADSLLFRQRCGLLLEKACVKIAITKTSRQLLGTVIEAMIMFKIGCPSLDDNIQKWFSEVMKKTYGENGLPKLTINKSKVETLDEAEIANDDTCTLSLEIVRGYAESVVKYKSALYQKQGLDPRLALQGYREGWWIIISAKRQSKKAKSEFLFAQPFFVTNPAQKVVNHEVKFKAPSLPGKYIFTIEIKSTEYIGADESFEKKVDVVDKDDLPDKEDSNDDKGE